MGQLVTFPSQNYQLTGYLARSENATDELQPAIVVIHEIYGLNDNIKSVADRFAEQGFVALAVDLYSGRNKALCMVQTMGDFLKQPNQKNGVADLRASLSYLLGQPGVDTNRVGAIGFCSGGHYALAWASTDQRVKVIAPYYATNPRPLESVRQVCPVVASYPTKDFTAGQGHKLEAALEQYGIAHDFKFYPEAQHSFFNDRSKRHSPQAAQDSWERVLAFFDQHLGGITNECKQQNQNDSVHS